MIVDFVFDVVFGLANGLVGLLPDWGYINISADPDLDRSTELLLGVAVAYNAISTANYLLPLAETVRLLMYYMAGFGFIALYRFFLRIKSW